MLFATTKNLKWKIVEILASTKKASAQEIWQAATPSARKCSIQAIYMHLRSLRADGVVVHSKGLYSIGIWWAQEFLGLAHTLEENLFQSMASGDLLPEKGKPLTWHFTNLIRMDDLWVQLINASFKSSKSRSMHIWIPHPWYFYAQKEKNQNFYSVLVKKHIRYYGIVGGQTFLDRLYVRETPRRLLKAKFGAPSFLPSPRVHECIIGPYIITVTLSRLTYQQIDQFFQSVLSLQTMDLRKLFFILNSKTRCRLSIEYSEKKAEAKRAAYSEYLENKPQHQLVPIMK